LRPSLPPEIPTSVVGGFAPEVVGEDFPLLELGVGAFAEAAQGGLGAVGGSLRLGQGRLAAFAFVAGDHLRVQANVAEVGEESEERQDFLGDAEAAGGGDVDGASGQDAGDPDPS
jgi:hypothetical protein